MAKKIPPFMGKETKAEEAKEMKVSAAAYKRGEKAEGLHGKSGMEKPSKYATAQKFSAGGMGMPSSSSSPRRTPQQQVKLNTLLSGMINQSPNRPVVRPKPLGGAMKGGGKVEKMANGGFTRAADGVAQKGKTKAQRFDDGGAVMPTVVPPIATQATQTPLSPPAWYQQIAPTKAPVQTPVAPALGVRQRFRQRPRPMASQPSAPAPAGSNEAAIRQMYAQNQTATRYNPNGPDAQAMAYWNDKINKSGLGAVQGGMFNKEVKDYEDADFAKRMAERRAAIPAKAAPTSATRPIAPTIPKPANYVAPTGAKRNGSYGNTPEEMMKRGGAVKSKAYAKGGCVSGTPAMKSGGDVKKARGGGCEVKGKTKGRYI